MITTVRVLRRIRDAVFANFVVPRSPNCCLIEWKGSPWQVGIRVDQSLQRVGFGINPFVEAFIMPVQLHPPWKLAFFRRMNAPNGVLRVSEPFNSQLLLWLSSPRFPQRGHSL